MPPEAAAIPRAAGEAIRAEAAHISVAVGIQVEERISAVAGRISPHAQRRISPGGWAVAVHVCRTALHHFVQQVTARRRIPLRLVA